MKLNMCKVLSKAQQIEEWAREFHMLLQEFSISVLPQLQYSQLPITVYQGDHYD